MTEVEDTLLAPLFRDGPIAEKDFLRIIGHVHPVDPRDAELAERLVPGASEVLEPGHISTIIRADISTDDAKRDVQEARLRYRRYLPLLPTLFRHLRLERRYHALNVIFRVDDCCREVPTIARQGRRDSNKRKLLKELASSADMVGAVEALFDRLRYVVGSEFDSIMDAHEGAKVPVGGWHPPYNRLSSMHEALQFLRGAIEIRATLVQDGEAEPLISDNQVKAHIVECAYDLTRVYGGPPLVTTPGSDFAFVCSLIYEMATGKPDASMAGAISRFARSDARREADEYDQEEAALSDRTKPVDNFASSRRTTEMFLAEATKYAGLYRDPRLSKDASYCALLITRRAVEKAEAASSEYGPFLLWVDQYSETHREQLAQEQEKLTEEMRKLDTRLGELRRKELKMSRRE